MNELNFRTAIPTILFGFFALVNIHAQTPNSNWNKLSTLGPKNTDEGISEGRWKRFWKQTLNIDSVNLYGGGEIFNLVSNPDQDAEGGLSPSGSLGVNLKSKRLRMSLYFSFNVPTTQNIDTLADLGKHLISPDFSGTSTNLDLRWRIFPSFNFLCSSYLSDAKMAARGD